MVFCKARGCAGLKSATFKAKSFAGRPPAPAALPKPHGDLPTRCKVRFSSFVGEEEERFLRIAPMRAVSHIHGCPAPPRPAGMMIDATWGLLLKNCLI